MKAKDLRIGNYILCDGQTRVVTGISPNGFINFIHYGNRYKRGSDTLQAIPITPEILEKAGFVNDTIGHYDIAFILKSDWREQPSFHLYIEYTDSPFEQDQGKHYPIAHELKHLHRLQNLYHALTGEELDINP